MTVNQNQVPVINLSSTPNPTAIPGEVYSYDVPAYDPNGDRLTYTLDSGSVEKGFTVDENGRVRWAPEASDAGNHPVTIVDTGGNFATSEETILVEGELKLGNFQLSFVESPR